ncbi:Frag1/DRAM/Sfk1 family-domain-containing protein [Cercophora scortea]|uniref:Frag1/DRAM/Sfk1 family-domain-containing protein n=1 Tax=Cercophora scortea TaxID=314031 RepID=A0AAE0ILL9_9PEZI|nr:Frag1/DRAM/Sfk1 family-domain-containing protein [Cercophora scortea]
MLRISYWVYPIISGVIWLGTLLGLLIYWTTDAHREHYISMADSQSIAYISDVGASRLKPLFITGCVLTTVFLDASFLADRWLRHRGRLVPNTTRAEKILSALVIACAVVGTAGLILLSVFDTANHPRLHDIFLLLFIAGYIFSAIFICWEYQRLGMKYREHRVLRVSFWIKLVFVLVEVVLAIAFVSCTFTSHYNAGAVLEWAIAIIFSFYVFSFYVDLYPAVYTKDANHQKQKDYHGQHTTTTTPTTTHEMEEGTGSDERNLTGGTYAYRARPITEDGLPPAMTTNYPPAPAAAVAPAPARGVPSDF